tara:strand:+ start:2833 stop:3081 length:249 start_codon:yes stop_codon:yes gene_type:complete
MSINGLKKRTILSVVSEIKILTLVKIYVGFRSLFKFKNLISFNTCSISISVLSLKTSILSIASIKIFDVDFVKLLTISRIYQ